MRMVGAPVNDDETLKRGYALGIRRTSATSAGQSTKDGLVIRRESRTSETSWHECLSACLFWLQKFSESVWA